MLYSADADMFIGRHHPLGDSACNRPLSLAATCWALHLVDLVTVIPALLPLMFGDRDSAYRLLNDTRFDLSEMRLANGICIVELHRMLSSKPGVASPTSQMSHS